MTSISQGEPAPSTGARGTAGVIRRSRRPAGWRAPGPPPRVPDDAFLFGPRAGEDLCYLSGDWRILQRVDGHRWSLDDLVTAWVAADELRARPPLRIADLGCGIGSVLLMTAWRFAPATVVGVEAQAISVDLARRSIAWNGVADRCVVHHGDLRDPHCLAGDAGFDLVTGTPPYFQPGEGPQSSRPQFAPCHFEHRGGLETYCERAAEMLAARGTFVVCAAANQHARMGAAARAAGLRVVRRLPVVPRRGKDVLFSVYAMDRGAAAAPMRCDAPLVVRERDGKRTAAFVALRAEMGMPP